MGGHRCASDVSQLAVGLSSQCCNVSLSRANANSAITMLKKAVVKDPTLAPTHHPNVSINVRLIRASSECDCKIMTRKSHAEGRVGHIERVIPGLCRKKSRPKQLPRIVTTVRQIRQK